MMRDLLTILFILALSAAVPLIIRLWKKEDESSAVVDRPSQFDDSDDSEDHTADDEWPSIIEVQPVKSDVLNSESIEIAIAQERILSFPIR